jgi:hypothetical protein
VCWFGWSWAGLFVRLFVCSFVCLVGGLFGGCLFVCLLGCVFVRLVVRCLLVVSSVVNLVVGILLRVRLVASIWLVTIGHRPKRHFAESPFGCLHFAGYHGTPPKSGGCLRFGVLFVPFCLFVGLSSVWLCVVWFFVLVGRCFLCLAFFCLVVLVGLWVGCLGVFVGLFGCLLVFWCVVSVGLSVFCLSFCLFVEFFGLSGCWCVGLFGFCSFVCSLVCLSLVGSFVVSWWLFVTDVWSRSLSSRVLVVRAGAPIATFFR